MFVDVWTSITGALSRSRILELLGSVWTVLTKIAHGIASGIGTVISSFIAALANADFSGAIDTLNSLSFTGILIGIKKFIDNAKDGLGGIVGIKDSIIGVLDGVKGCLESWQKDIKANALLKIASAIGILAIALTLIAGIDSEKLFGALTAITVLFGDLVGSMSLISKFDGQGGSKAMGTMIGLSIAVAILAKALKKVGGMDSAELENGLSGITALMIELVAAAKILAADSKKSIKGMFQMILLALAMKIFVSVIKSMSTLSWSDLLLGLAGIGGILLEFAGFQALMKLIKPKKMLSSALGLILIGAAMKIFANVCAKFAQMEWGDLAKAGTAIGGILVLTAGFELLAGRSKKMLRSATALMLIGAALEIFADITNKFAQMEWGDLAKAGTAIGGILLISAGFMLLSGMAKHLAGSAIALTLIAASMEVFAHVCNRFGSMDWESLAKAGAAIGGILLLVSGFALLAGLAPHILASSAALLVISVSLAMLTPVLKALGNMSWESIAKSLLMLAGAFAVIGVAGLLLGPIVPAILGLAGALALVGVAAITIGAGLLLAGVGLTAFGAGLTAIAASLAATATAIVGAISIIVIGIEDLLPVLITKVGAVLRSVCEIIIQNAPAIGKAIKAVILTLIDVLVECIPQIIDGLLTLIESLLTSLVAHIPGIVNGIFDFIIALLNGVAARLPDLIEAVVGVVMSLFQGVIDALNGVDPETLVNGILAIGMLTAMMLSLSLCAALAVPAMAGVVAMGLVVTELAAVLTALGALSQIPGINDLVASGGGLLQNIGSAIGGFVGSIVGGFMESVSSKFPQIGSDLSAFMENLAPFIDGASKLDASMLDGVNMLVGTIMSLTKAELLSSVTAWLTGGSSLSDFGSQLANFGPQFASFADSVSGIDTAAVTAAATAFKTFAEAARDIPNEGGFVSLFTGDNSLEMFGTELAKFGPQFASFASATSGIDPNTVEGTANALRILLETVSEIPNEGGLVSLFTGDNSLADFGEQLVPFGRSLAAYGEAVSGIQKYTPHIRASKTAAEYIVSIAEVVPKSGGLVSLITGDNDLGEFASNLKPFGQSIMDYGKSVVGIDTYLDDILDSAKAASNLIVLADSIPKSGGLAGLISGNQDLKSFADGLIPFGESLMSYGLAVGGMSEAIGSIHASIEAADAVISLAKTVKYSASGSELSTFGKNLVTLGDDMKKFMDKCKEFTAGDLDSLIAALGTLRDIAFEFSAIDTSAIETFVTSMETIGSTSLNAFLDSFSNAKDSASAAINTLMTDLTLALKTWHGKLTTKFKVTAEAGLKGLTEKRSAFKDEGKALGKKLGDGVETEKSNVVRKFTSILTACVNAIRGQRSQFQSAGAYLAEGFANGISSSTPNATTAASNMANNAAKAANRKLEINSPSKVGYRIGNFFGLGFTKGIDANVNHAGLSGENLADSAQSNLSMAIAKILAILDGELDTSPTIRPVLDLTEIQNGAEAMASLMNSLSGQPVEGTVSIARRTANGMAHRTVMPKDPELIESAGGDTSTTTNNFYITGSDPREIANAVDRKLQLRVERRKATWA